MIIKLYGISAIQYHELDTFMGNRTNEIIFDPSENSIKITMKLSESYSPEEVLLYMCRKIEFFEESLEKALNKNKTESDIEFEKKLIKKLGENKSKEYGIFSGEPITGEKIFEQLKPQRTEFMNINGYFVGKRDEDGKEYFKSIIKKFLVPVLLSVAIYLVFYITKGYEIRGLVTSTIGLLLIPVVLAFMWSELLRPSYILTKKFGLREKFGEKFYGTLSNGMTFCVMPCNGRRIFKDQIFFNSYGYRRLMHQKTPAYYDVDFKIKLDNGVEYCVSRSVTEDMAGMVLEEGIINSLNEIARTYGIECENILVERNHRYNIISIIFNILTFRRCVAFLYVFFPIFFILAIEFYEKIVFKFIEDFIKYL